MKIKGLTRALSLLAMTSLAAIVAVSAQQTRPGQQPPIFRSTTDYVTTDVIVRDKTGRFLPDLTQQDFEVFEDGVRQTVSHFVQVIGGRAVVETAPPPPRREGLILPPSKPPTEAGRIFIIFIDDLHLQPLDSIKARKVLEQIRDTVIHDGDLVGIVSSGFSSISFDLSPDYRRARFNEAIEKTMGSGMTPREIINASQSVDGPTGLRASVFTAFRTAYEILDQAEKVQNRRKAFIYVSSGYDFNPFTNSRYKNFMEFFTDPNTSDPSKPDNRLDPLTTGVNANGTLFRNPFETGHMTFAETDLIAAIAELTRRASRANVTFYTVDPRGLIAGPDMSMPITWSEYEKYVSTSISSLRVLGDETGGFCICQTNDFKTGLQRIDNEMSDYYLIGYTSTNPDPMRRTRRIEIKVKREDAVDLIYKPQYTLDASKGR
jgi:VWFA-related protein